MKVSNETKIGIIAIATLLLLFFGFSYMKGKNVFKKETLMYAVYQDVMGLKKSNPVIINGLQVGSIADIDGGTDMRSLIVTVSFSKEVNIPDNSIAIINPNLLGSPSLEIQLGNSEQFKKSGDTLITSASTGVIDEALKVLNPVLYEVKNAVQSLDSVLNIVALTFDPDTKDNVKSIVRNLDMVTQSFTATARSLEIMMHPQTGALGQSLNNINSFTANLSKNNEVMDSIMGHVNIASSKFSELDLSKTLDTLEQTINNFKEISDRINNKEGSLGLLLGDEGLYKNLESTTQKVNILIDDIRVNPRRYVNISVFGKKDKKNYLTSPLVDDTVLLINSNKQDTLKIVSQ